MSTTSVKVAIRVRPLTAKELLDDARECIQCFTDINQINIGIERTNFSSQGQDIKSFSFDHVLDTSSSQDQIYAACGQSLVDTFLNGFNSTIFAYGQTGSGKTFTMGAGLENLYDPENQGIIPRSIHEVFSVLNRKVAENPLGFKYSLSATFIELYNEDLADLLNPRPRSAGSGSWGGLTIREDSQGNIVWSGIRDEPVFSPEDLLSLLQKGTLCRTTGSTDMNASSSRSHAIFSLCLKQQKWIPSNTNNFTSNNNEFNTSDSNLNQTSSNSLDEVPADAHPNPTTVTEGSWQKITSKFHFVDLAGSERLKKTNAEGDRKREGININKGLLVLGNVIHALSDDSKLNGSGPGHVPYRESKLTRLLQDSLGGNSQTLMLACVSPSTTNYAESLNTLQYANRAKNIKNKVSINQEWSSAASEKELRHLRSMVSKLQTEIAIMRTKGGSSELSLTDDSSAIGVNGHRINSLTKRISQVEAQQFERQLTQAQASQAAMQQELKNVIDELEQTKFDKARFAFKYSKLCERIQSLYEELESLKFDKALHVGENREEQIKVHIQKMIELKKQLTEAEDKLFWHHDVIEKISKREPMNENSTLAQILNGTDDGDKDSLDKAFDAAQQKQDVKGYPELTAEDKMLFRIHKDILSFEKQLAQLSKKDHEHDVMKHAYEQKLKVLQEQLFQTQRERDMVMSKVHKPDFYQQKEKPGTLVIKTKFEKENKRLEAEVNDLKKKLNSKVNNKFRHEQMVKSMKNQLSSIRVEKQLLEKKLKEESEKNRELLSAKMRELAKMRKKQEKTAEIARKLARSEKLSQGQSSSSSGGLQFGGEASSQPELHTSQSMFSLKKSSSSNKISESQTNLSTRLHRGTSRRGRTRSLSPDSMAFLFQSGGTGGSLSGLMPDIQGKKASIEKELWMCQNAKKISFVVRDLESTKERLLTEQRELFSEREKCVEMDAEETGFMDPNKPQYMDDRLTVIENELDVVDMRLDELRMQTMHFSHEQMQEDGSMTDGRGGGTNEFSNLHDGQIAWSNVAAMLSSLRTEEMLILIQEYLDELMNARVYQEDLTNKISEKEKIVLELRAALDLMRNAAMEAAMDAERRLSDVQQYSRRLLGLIKDCYDGNRAFPESMDAFVLELSDGQNSTEGDTSILENQNNTQRAPSVFALDVGMSSNNLIVQQTPTHSIPSSTIPNDNYHNNDNTRKQLSSPSAAVAAEALSSSPDYMTTKPRFESIRSSSNQQQTDELKSRQKSLQHNKSDAFVRTMSSDHIIAQAAENDDNQSKYERDRFEIYEALKEEKSMRRSSFDRLIQLGSNAISKLRRRHEKSNLSRSVSSIYPVDEDIQQAQQQSNNLQQNLIEIETDVPEDIVGGTVNYQAYDECDGKNYGSGGYMAPRPATSAIVESALDSSAGEFGGAKLTLERGLLKKVNVEQNEKKKYKSQMNLKAVAASSSLTIPPHTLQSNKTLTSSSNTNIGSETNVFSRLHQSHTISSEQKRK